MNLRRALRWLRGYVRVRCKGGFFGKLSAELTNLGADIDDISRIEGAVVFSVDAKSYLMIRPLAKKYQCSVRITDKRGLRYRLRKIRRFRVVSVGCACFLLALLLLGQIVFTIRFIGELPAPESEMLSALREVGVFAGARISSIDAKTAEQQLLLRLKQLEWAAVNVSYGRVTVEMRLKKEKPEQLTGTKASALAASRDAVIERVDINSGIALVREGDVVRRGDLLVLPDESANPLSWTANISAVILGRTERTATFEVPKEQIVFCADGRASTERFVGLFDLEIPITPFKREFELCESVKTERRLELFGAKLPFYLTTLEITGLSQRVRTISEPEARAQLERQLDDYAAALESAVVTKTESHFVETDGAFVLFALLYCTEEVCEPIY